MTGLSDFVCNSIEEFFDDEDEFDKLLSSVGQEELDNVLENSGTLVEAAPQPHPSFETAAPRDLYSDTKTKTGTNTLCRSPHWNIHHVPLFKASFIVECILCVHPSIHNGIYSINL